MIYMGSVTTEEQIQNIPEQRFLTAFPHLIALYVNETPIQSLSFNYHHK